MSTTHNLQQGSEGWKAFRASKFGASEAAAMLGISQYKSRDELLREKATGITPDINIATQRLFDAGHELEELARPIAENIIGEDLFQPTMSMDIDGLPLSCSCDGLTLMRDFVWECKTLNENLRSSLPGSIPDQYHPQLEQMMMITGAEKAMFMAFDGELHLHCWYESNPSLRKQIISGWKQFQKDLAAYTPSEPVVEVVAETVDDLPAITVNVSGSLAIKSNLDAFKKSAIAFIGNIKTELKTDQDFSNAEAIVKFCGAKEKDLDIVKQNMLGQVASVDETVRAIDSIKGELKTRRLFLDKLVKAQKQAMRETIILAAKSTFSEHMQALNHRFIDSVRMPDVTADFAGAIKGKRTIQSLRSAANDELARAKIEANEIADRIDINIKALLKATGGKYDFLFHDIQQIITKDGDDFINLVNARINEHIYCEEKRIEAEREQIRKEEQAKAEAEQKRIAAEEQKKAEAKAAAIKRYDDELERKRLEAEQQASASVSPQKPAEQAQVEPVHNQEAAAERNWYTCNACGAKVYDGYECECDKSRSNVRTLTQKQAQQPEKTLMWELARWCDKFHLSMTASAELCEIVESYMPEQARKA